MQVPLEIIEDRIIEALDFVMLTPGIPQRSQLKNLLEHLQYNVAVMHQQVLDETPFNGKKNCRIQFSCNLLTLSCVFR